MNHHSRLIYLLPASLAMILSLSACGKRDPSSSAQLSPQSSNVKFKSEWLCYQQLRPSYLNDPTVSISEPGSTPEQLFVELRRKQGTRNQLTLFSDRTAAVVTVPEFEKEAIYQVNFNTPLSPRFIHVSKVGSPSYLSWSLRAIPELPKDLVKTGDIAPLPINEEAARGDVVYAIQDDLQYELDKVKGGQFKGDKARLRGALNVCGNVLPSSITTTEGEVLKISLKSEIKELTDLLGQ